MKVLAKCTECDGMGAIPMYIPEALPILIGIDELPYKKCEVCKGSGSLIIDVDGITEYDGSEQTYCISYGC